MDFIPLNAAVWKLRVQLQVREAKRLTGGNGIIKDTSTIQNSYLWFVVLVVAVGWLLGWLGRCRCRCRCRCGCCCCCCFRCGCGCCCCCCCFFVELVFVEHLFDENQAKMLFNVATATITTTTYHHCFHFSQRTTTVVFIFISIIIIIIIIIIVWIALPPMILGGKFTSQVLTQNSFMQKAFCKNMTQLLLGLLL